MSSSRLRKTIVFLLVLVVWFCLPTANLFFQNSSLGTRHHPRKSRTHFLEQDVIPGKTGLTSQNGVSTQKKQDSILGTGCQHRKNRTRFSEQEVVPGGTGLTSRNRTSSQEEQDYVYFMFIISFIVSIQSLYFPTFDMLMFSP